VHDVVHLRGVVKNHIEGPKLEVARPKEYVVHYIYTYSFH
jgi:hypothetical protein